MRVADEIRDTSRFDKELDESPEASFEVPVLLHDTAGSEAAARQSEVSRTLRCNPAAPRSRLARYSFRLQRRIAWRRRQYVLRLSAIPQPTCCFLHDGPRHIRS